MSGDKQVRPFQPGTRFKDGKLYRFDHRGVLVLRQWPDLQAWVKTVQVPVFRSLRPRVDLIWMVRRVRDLHNAMRKEALSPSSRSLDAASQPDYVPPVNFSNWILGEDAPEGERKARMRAFTAWAYGPGSLPGMYPSQVHTARALDRFLEPIPNDILESVTVFRSGYWQLLQASARIDDFFLLMEDLPALAWLLAHVHIFHPTMRPLRTARALMRRRRRDILGVMGFPGTEATVRLLRKIPVRALRRENLLNLRTILADPDMARMLAHLPRLNAGVLALVIDPDVRPCLTHGLLEDVALDTGEDGFARTAFDMSTYAESWRYCRPGIPIPTIRNREDLAAIIENRRDILRNVDAELLLTARLPGPPIPGNAQIEPLLYPDLIALEGKQQNNCLVHGDWVRKVLQQKVYLYQLNFPERATFSIECSNGRWTLGDVRCESNRPASAATRIFLRNWLSLWQPWLAEAEEWAQ